MKKTTKKILPFMLAAMLMLTQLSVPAFAEGLDGVLSDDNGTAVILDNFDDAAETDEAETFDFDSAPVDDGEKGTDDDSVNAHPYPTADENEDIQETSIAVYTEEIPVQSVSFSVSKVFIESGTSQTLQPTIEPYDATNKTVFWYSVDENIATVNGSGEISAISPGTTTIRATTEDGGYAAFCTVTVLEIPDPPMNVIAIPGDEKVVLYWDAPTNHGYGEVYYFASIDSGLSWRHMANSSTSSVYDGLTNGTEYSILLKAVNKIGESALSIPVTAMPVNKFTMYGVGFYDSLVYGDTGKYVSTFGGGEGVVSYQSDNEEVLSVSSEGALTIHKAGSATITAIKYINDGQIEASDSMLITINKMPISVVFAMLYPKTYDGTKTGQAADLNFNVHPLDLTLDLDYYAVVEYDNENAGNNRTATVSVFLNNTEKADNYILGDNNTLMVYGYGIEKAQGGIVSTPILESSTETSVSVYPVTNDDGTEQPIEYAISQESGIVPASGWQADTYFNDLAPNTQYYVYARTQENDNYYAGTAQQSATIQTLPNELETFTVSFIAISERGQLTMSIDNIDYPQGSAIEKGKTVVLTATPNPGYKISSWVDRGRPVNGANDTYIIYDISDNHYIGLNFGIQIFSVTVSSEGENHYGSGVSPFENWVHISAGEPPAGKRFSHWETSSDGVIFDSPTSSKTYFPMPANDVTVTAVFEDMPPTVSSVTITPNDVDIQKGISFTFSVAVLGENNPSQSVTWEVLGGIYDTTITSDGLLSISLNETAQTLTVKAVSIVDSDKFDVATVSVMDVPPILPTVSNVEIVPDTVSLDKGSSLVFSAIVTGENDPPQSVEWNVLGGGDGTSITSDGTLIIGIDESADSLTVVATSSYDMSKSCSAAVTVTKAPPVTSTVSVVDVTPGAVVLNRGETYDFSATITGLNNPSQAVIWSVIGGNEVTGIDLDGRLTVGSDESATELTVKATSVEDVTKFGTATVTVMQPPTLPTISFVEVMPDTVTVDKGTVFSFTADVHGDNDPPQSVLWSVSGGVNETVIDDEGILTVSDYETADTLTITAISTFDGSKFGTAIVSVSQTPITTKPQLINPETPAITENPKSVTVNVGGSASMSVAASVTDGGTLSYQWYRNSTGSNTGGTLIEGATDATYIPPTNSVGVTHYYVIITNSLVGEASNGISATVSNPAVLTVRNYPSNDSGNVNNSDGFSNSGDSNGQDDTDDESIDFDAENIEVFAYDNLISINGMPANAEINGDGILEVIYTASDLTDYTDKSGDCVIEIIEQSHIYLSLPIPALEDDTLTIKTDFGIVTVPNSTLQALQHLYGDELRLIIKKGSFIITFADSNGEEAAYSDCSNPFFIALPYALPEGQNANSVIAVKKTDEGNTVIPLSYYKDGYIIFPVTSTGAYDVLYNPKAFTDTANHRAVDSVSFVSARGLFGGTGNGVFSPDETMTRAMFLTVLARLAEADLSQYTTSRFNDVPFNSWYAAPIEWAASIGLVVGVGNGNFAPDAPITREEMALVLDRYIKISGYSLTPLPEVTSLTDSEKISSWAVEAAENIRKAGIISENEDLIYEPQGVTTRAEAAAVFVRLIGAINR